MKKATIMIMIITLLSKVFGFAREITLSYIYGASSISDAYIVSQTIPMFIFSFIGTGIATGYIPIYSKIRQCNGVDEGERFTNNLVNALTIVCTIITMFCLLFTNQIVYIFASGFGKDTLELAVQLTRISVLGIYFIGLIYVASGFLQINGNFAIPALSGFPLNIIIIFSILISYNAGIIVLAIGSVLAVASQLMFMLPSIYKKGYKYRFILDVKDEHIQNMTCIALPLIIGVSVNQINVLIDKTIASQVAVGGISALNYASRLNGFIQGIFVLSVSTVLYPTISKMTAENNIEGLKKAVSEAVSGINILVMPATIGAIIFAEPIVKLLFGRGVFDLLAISDDIRCFIILFYRYDWIWYQRNTIKSLLFITRYKTPMINAVISMLMNIVLNIILSRYMGIGGLALATSISAIFCTGLLFVSLREENWPVRYKKSVKYIFKNFLRIINYGNTSKFTQ